MKEFATWCTENRTKLLGYTGMALAQLGTSGIVTNSKAIAWIGFGASMCTAAVGHFNDYKAKRGAAVKPDGSA